MQFQSISVSSSGDNQVIAAPTDTGVKIRVYGYVIVAAGSVTAQWFSDASSGGTALSGAMTMATGTPISSPPLPASVVVGMVGCLETSPGKQLNLKLGSGVQVSGHLLFDYIKT